MKRLGVRNAVATDVRFRRDFVLLATSLSCIKLLLMPAEHSTDMDVHLHWKALTTTLPIQQWYSDTSSKWSLDYPPLFAYFEYLLGRIAPASIPLVLDAKASDSRAAFYYLRATALALDPLLACAVYKLLCALRRRCLTSAALALGLPALFLVDTVHFQYNALPLALLLGALACVVRRRMHFAVALLAAAVNTKHLLLPLLPMLASVVLGSLLHARLSIGDLLRRAITITACFLVILAGPWWALYAAGGTTAVRAALARLFPFGRGLLHALWAGNFWALYAAADRLLLAVGWGVRHRGSTTAGVIGESKPFGALPNPMPAACAGAVVAALLPVALTAVVQCRRRHAPLLAAYAALAAFAFGWHVHEKNILVALLPLAASVGAESAPAPWLAFALLSIGGQLGVMPLITGPRVALYRVAHYAAYNLLVVRLVWQRVRSHAARFIVISYLFGAFVVEWYSGVGGGHQLLFGSRLEFLPLAVVSLYASVGVLSSLFILFYWLLHAEAPNSSSP